VKGRVRRVLGAGIPFEDASVTFSNDNEERIMIFGMAIFTFVHFVISLIGIGSGLVVVYGFLTAKRLDIWTAVFLATTILTSVTGFLFPFEGFTPAHAVGIISLLVLAVAMAVVYARELTRWGIETSIIVPGAFTAGTNHFAHAGSPADKARAAEYNAGPNAGFADQVLKGFSSIVPADADVSAVAEAIVKVVDTPFGKRPFRIHIDPTQDGAEVVNAVSDRVRAEFLRRIGLSDVLTPRDLAAQSQSAS
jgi:hypothetical protein